MDGGVTNPVRILVVDDDPGDVLMIEEALADSESTRSSTWSVTARRRWSSCVGRAGTSRPGAPT